MERRLLTSELMESVMLAFKLDMAREPLISLRGGNQIDDYEEPSPFDPSDDGVTDEYLHKYCVGLTFLDAASWRHYLPYFIDYSVRHISAGELATNSLIWSLRPPDRDPPRLSTLTADQEAVITQFLELLAFDDNSSWQEGACQALDEWWLPGARYRPKAK
jgi:hypothetical protein